MRKRKISDPELFAETKGNVEKWEKSKNVHHLSAVYAFYIVGYVVAIHFFVSTIDGLLPRGLRIKDEVDRPDAFIAERAKRDLRVLTNIGPKVVGSYDNEILAVGFLLEEIDQIVTHKGDNYHEDNRIEVSLQLATGSYFLPFKPYGCINAYAAIQNVVVKFNSNGQRNNSAILINAHFDSVPTSPGGSDDGIMVVTMLEILRKLVASNTTYRHDVVFLFNGAEESSLQGSHAFITQHEWRENVKLIVNLEAAGAGSKEILFQSGPGRRWLLEYYARVPRPHGQAAGEELFQSGAIPSDTDYRVFRDHGHLYGYDFAFYRDGYRYHTRYDAHANIPYGSYQHVGENALSLIRRLADAEEIDADEIETDTTKSVYYDALGLFMVRYGTAAMRALNYGVCAVSLIVIVYVLRRFVGGVCDYLYLFYVTASITCGWTLAIVGNFAVATLVDSAGSPMIWYANPSMIHGLYDVPAFVCVSAPIVLLNYFYRGKYSMAVQSQVQYSTVNAIFTAVLFVGTLLNVRSTYPIMLTCVFNTVAAAINVVCRFDRQSVLLWRCIQLIAVAIPIAFHLYFRIVLYALIVPLCGRIGTTINPDLVIAMLSTLFVVLISSHLTNFYALMTRAHRFLALIGVAFIVCFALTLLRQPFPYDGAAKSPKPQRHWITHTNRRFHDIDGRLITEDNGYFMLNMDRNSPRILVDRVDRLREAVPLDRDCDRFLYCGLPLQHSRMVQLARHSTWIPTDADDKLPVDDPVTVILNGKSALSNGTMRFNFTIDGPDHISVYLSPKRQSKVTAISLLNDLNQATWDTWNGDDVLFIKYVYGRDKTPLTFHVDVVQSSKVDGDAVKSSPLLELVVCGHYIHDFDVSRRFDAFLNQFPEWTDVTVALATYESWLF